MSGKTKCPIFIMAQMINGKTNQNESEQTCIGPICEWYVRRAYTDDQTTTEGCSIRLQATKSDLGLQTA